uniref:Alkaline phosphatase family protein n=2 Tax=Macrostomum lignano TaxID=282301 RepID=A0A1I8GMT0_9PLAT
ARVALLLIAALLAQVSIACGANHSAGSPPGRLPLLIVIFDGFRHDYLELYRSRGVQLPNFEAFASQGVRAKRVKNVYPTETLPNHQSLVTGLYSESHGFILNTFADPELPGKLFSVFDQSSLNDPDWSAGWPEPLWVTNQRQGGRSAVVLYPNSDLPYNGFLPFVQVDQYATLNNGSSVRYPYSRRVSRMLHWLGQPQLYGINLGLLYFDEPDHTAHQAGHLSDDVAARLIELDQQLGQLMTGLKELGLTDRINIVLTADHGMTTGNSSNLIDLDQIVNPDWYVNYLADKANIHLGLMPKPGRAQDIIKAVSDAKLPYLRANLASHLPDWMHFNGSRRTPPVYLYADPPYVIVVGGIPPEHPATFGVHGYANNDTDMWPLWLARGPAFQSGGVEIDQLIESVDLYPLACRLLGIRANPNNGSLDRISAVLSSPDWLLVEPIPTGNKFIDKFLSDLFDCWFNKYRPYTPAFVLGALCLFVLALLVIVSYLACQWRTRWLKLRIDAQFYRAAIRLNK